MRQRKNMHGDEFIPKWRQNHVPYLYCDINEQKNGQKMHLISDVILVQFPSRSIFRLTREVTLRLPRKKQFYDSKIYSLKFIARHGGINLLLRW